MEKRCSLTSSVTSSRLHELFSARGYRADMAQQAAIEQLAHWLSTFFGPARGWLRRRSAGVYVHGAVGRGKSVVMDAAFAAAPFEHKRRVHVHALLQDVQQRMAVHAGHADPMRRVAADIASQSRLLCVDEFHVHDIGDAVLLARLLGHLVEAGVGLICTSNYAPAGLCPNPLYRGHFQPTIDLLLQRFVLVHLDAGCDYREQSPQVWGKACWPVEEQSACLGEWLGLPEAAQGDVCLSVNHHPMHFRAVEGQRAWLTFAELCCRPRNSADYLWLCRQFHTLAVDAVPDLAGESLDVQQRFVNFIDIAYDNGRELLLGCRVDPHTLCQGGSLADLSRTHSRLAQLESCRV